MAPTRSDAPWVREAVPRTFAPRESMRMDRVQSDNHDPFAWMFVHAHLVDSLNTSTFGAPKQELLVRRPSLGTSSLNTSTFGAPKGQNKLAQGNALGSMRLCDKP
jgi:hypothetical protein